MNGVISEAASSTTVSSRALLLHAMMYGLNLYAEINQLRQQYTQNKYQVFYFSRVLTSCELFIEFFFEILNEKNEPLIALVELGKAAMRFKEYHDLVTKEHFSTYIQIETY